MLETEIKNLTAEIALLRGILEDLSKTLNVSVPPIVSKPTPQFVDAGVTVQELQDLCLELTRANRENKAKIKEIIASFDGSKVLAEVNPKDFEALKKTLEELK